MAEKKNPDFTESVEKLCNPIQVKDLLDQLHLEEKTKADLEIQLREQSAELVDGIAKMGVVIADTQKQIKEAIEQFGSYQNVETGEYGVKVRRISKSYDAKEFADFFPNYTPAVVIQTINVKALEGLIKGGLIKEDELRNCGVLREDTTYAFIIR